MKTRIGIIAVLLASTALAQVNPGVDQPVNTSSRRSGKTTQVLVLNSAATLVPTVNLAGRKTVLLQNLGPNAIFCTVGGETPLTTGALGYRIEAATATASTTLRLDAGSAIAIKCIAATADQATTAATQVTELR